MAVIKETSPQKILVLDGDLQTRSPLCIALSAQGYLVHVITSGREGIEIAADWAPDLIIMEVVFSDICGIELCQQLRLISQAPLLPYPEPAKAKGWWTFLTLVRMTKY